MGTIHRALDTLTGRELAYKRLLVEREVARPRMTALFRREYDTMMALVHPNTVEAYDFGFDADGPYYTMQLLSGSDLSRLAPLRWDVACRVLRDVASALALLHARRLLHRDVSPSNVRVTDEGVTKLLDYGGLTAFGQQHELVGTPQFLAPEALEGALDQRSDLFSLGALMYWTLTQKVCFRAGSLEELPKAWSKPIRPPSYLVPEIPRELDELVLSLLQFAPSARPPTAAHVIERLSNIASLEPEARERELALDYLRRPRLLERQAQIDLLRGSLAQVLSGNGRVVLMEARAGLGRSALLDRVTRDAQLAGATVLRADGGGQSAPFSLVQQLVKAGVQTFADSSPGPRKSEPSLYDGSSSQLMGPARNAMEAVELRTRVASFTQGKLLEFSLRSPLLIVVDDAQSADPDSIGMLAALSDELPRHPILLVLSLCDGDGGMDPHARARLEQRGLLLQLEPLSADGVIELVQTTFGDVPNARRLALFLHRESGGVPATAMDIARLLIERGDIVYRRGTFTLPDDVSLPHGGQHSEILLARLADLGAARRLLTILSVHGAALDLSLLAHASDVATRDVVLTLEPALARGLVRFAEGAYFVSSELLRKSLVAATGEGQLRTMHASIAKALLSVERPQLQDRLAAGYHRMCSGPEYELEGAELVATMGAQFARLGPAAGGAVVPVFEAALTVFRRHGRSDEACLDLTVVLTNMGMWGDLAAQRRHLAPTLQTLWRRCGLTLTQRLTPWIGGRLALYVGLLFGVVRRMFVRTRPARPLKRDLEALFGSVSSAVAAYASSFESREAAEAVKWLRPFAVLPPNTLGAVALDFALATVDLSAMRMQAASERYEGLLRRLDKGVAGIDPQTRDNLRAGCIHGQAEALAEHGDKRALELAAELEKNPFFGPHAQTVCVGYYVARGEVEAVERHRAKAEALALLGGVSWSAFSVLTVWCMYAAVLTEDAVALTQVIGALERQRDVSEPLRLFHELAQAHLENLRGHRARANERYAVILTSERGRQLTTHGIDVGIYAASLNEEGQYAHARDLCEQTLAGMEPNIPSTRLGKRFVVQGLARARAELGDHAGAYALLESCLSEVVGSDNDFALGLLHRDLAHVALLARDHERFGTHAHAAEKHLRATHSPSLLALHERLLTRAERAGFTRRLPPLGEEMPATDSLDDLGSTVLDGAGSIRPSHGEGADDSSGGDSDTVLSATVRKG